MDDIKNTIPGPNHILYQSARDIREIAAPLEKYLNIKEFTYERIYRNNKKIKLTNQPSWLAYYYQSNFHLLGEQETIYSLCPGVVLTSTLSNSDNHKVVFESCKKFFDIGDGLLLVEDFDGYRELYWFTSDVSNKYLTDYHHNIELLKIFTQSFKEKAQKIIRNAEYQKILFPSLTKQALTTNICPNDDRYEIAFLKSISVNKYRFYKGNLEIVLSKKELQCAVGLISGKSANEISCELYRSVRTIETHIDNIKLKLNCKSRSGLIGVLLDMGVDIYRNRIP